MRKLGSSPSWWAGQIGCAGASRAAPRAPAAPRRDRRQRHPVRRARAARRAPGQAGTTGQAGIDRHRRDDGPGGNDGTGGTTGTRERRHRRRRPARRARGHRGHRRCGHERDAAAPVAAAPAAAWRLGRRQPPGRPGPVARSAPDSTTPKPSAGCGKSGRPSGGKVQVANPSLHYFPTTYDGTKPFPLLIALHACGNPNTEFVSLTNGNGFDTTTCASFPNTPDSGQCWSNYSGDVARILSQYDDVVNNYCIDENRVFAIAHSSGAQMLVNILSHKTDAQHLNLKGVSPVAADPFNVAVPMPVLYIDGLHGQPAERRLRERRRRQVQDREHVRRHLEGLLAVATCMSTESGHLRSPRAASSTTTARSRPSGARTTTPATAEPSTASPASR